MLRIEDTDRERSEDRFVDAILDGLQWLGLAYDEGPFFQSQRLDVYADRIRQLLEGGHAYYCYCSAEELEAKRTAAQAAGLRPVYDRTCRELRRQPQEGERPVVRLCCPLSGVTAIDVMVRGHVLFENAELDDLILVRSDGSPTFHLTVVVDDIEMGITHVLRGEDHLTNTPRQLDADGPATDTTEEQLTRFRTAIEIVRASGFRVPLIHAANSAGAVRFPDAQFSLVRPGIMLYGYHTLPASIAAPDLKPVLTLRTTIAQLRTVQAGHKVSYNGTFTAKTPTKIAILPIGYADGLSRHLSNRGSVLIRGQRAPIAGLVCMDMIMVDVTRIAGVRSAMRQSSSDARAMNEITADDIAKWTGTIAYEVLCTIGPRVPRLYHEG